MVRVELSERTRRMVVRDAIGPEVKNKTASWGR
jgi:hypothetical protein